LRCAWQHVTATSRDTSASFPRTTVGILFSTVYLSLHYVTDLIAGAMLAAAMPLVLPPLRRMCAGPSIAAADHQAAVGS
jgi:hypothetical protein